MQVKKRVLHASLPANRRRKGPEKPSERLLEGGRETGDDRSPLDAAAVRTESNQEGRRGPPGSLQGLGLKRSVPLVFDLSQERGRPIMLMPRSCLSFRGETLAP